MPEDMPDHMPEDMPDRMRNRMSEDMSDRMPEDLPVRKCINVMVGITRSKVIFALRGLPARKDLLNNSQLKIEDGFPNQAAILNHIIISTQSSQEILKNSTASCHIF